MKTKLFVVAVVFLAALAAVIYSSLFPKRPALFVQNQAYFQGLRPGASKSTDATKALGQPIREESLASASSLLVFPSGLGNRPINITVDAQKTVQLVVVPAAPDKTFVSLAAPLGSPDATLYGDFARLGFTLSVYLSRGTALLANTATGEVKEQWYFAPTTLDRFQTALAPGYQRQPPPEGE